MDDRERWLEALRLLADLADSQLARHPWGHLVRSRPAAINLSLALPLGTSEEDLAELATQLQAALDAGLEEQVAHAASFLPGRVYCLRCRSPQCEHSSPAEPRQVFAGYGPTGSPRFLDFGQWLLDRRDPRIEQLFADAPVLVTLVANEPDLTRELLPAFRDAERDFHVCGQVAAGWYRIPDPTGRPHALAVTFQVVSSRPRGGRRRLGLNILGRGPEGESLDHLHDRLGVIPWTGAVRWGQSVLGKLGLSVRGKGGISEAALGRRIEGLLQGLARRLEREERARDRRTHHAEFRHTEGSRPTRMAVLDLSRAAPDQILFDTRRGTLVVLGDRGRTHIFSIAGKLITSVHYAPATIARRRESGLWRRATAAEAAPLQAILTRENE